MLDTNCGIPGQIVIGVRKAGGVRRRRGGLEDHTTHVRYQHVDEQRGFTHVKREWGYQPLFALECGPVCEESV
jgi:hypothetical protein